MTLQKKYLCVFSKIKKELFLIGNNITKFSSDIKQFRC